MGALRAKRERDLVVRGLSERTGRGYLRSVAGVARHYGRAPDTLTVAEVETYLVHLRQVRQLTWESLATVVTGLRFFYHVTLGRPRAQLTVAEAHLPETRLPCIALLGEEQAKGGHELPKHAHGGGDRIGR